MTNTDTSCHQQSILIVDDETHPIDGFRYGLENADVAVSNALTRYGASSAGVDP